MAALSVCRNLLRPLTTPLAVAKRYGGHGHRMFVVPSRFQWQKFKDAFHFYFLLGAIPCASLSLYLSIFYGDAQLREIPEGYEPEPYEYERHPITRFLVKYITPDLQENYERRLHYLNGEMESMLLNRIGLRVDYLMGVRRDYKAWYYQEMPAKSHRWVREQYQFMDARDGEPSDFAGEEFNERM